MSVGKIVVNGDVTEIDDATLEIGVKGGDFQTLATFQGDFYADDSDIDLTGMLTVDVNGQTVTLFDGEVDIPRASPAGTRRTATTPSPTSRSPGWSST